MIQPGTTLGLSKHSIRRSRISPDLRVILRTSNMGNIRLRSGGVRLITVNNLTRSDLGKDHQAEAYRSLLLIELRTLRNSLVKGRQPRVDA